MAPPISANSIITGTSSGANAPAVAMMAIVASPKMIAVRMLGSSPFHQFDTAFAEEETVPTTLFTAPASALPAPATQSPHDSGFHEQSFPLGSENRIGLLTE